jgi:hypothetical protein
MSLRCRKMKGFISLVSLVGLFFFTALPGSAIADVTSNGTASIDSLSFSFGGVAVDPATFFNLYQFSSSASQVGLNGVQTEISTGIDYSDGTFANTSITAALSDATGSVTGSASTSTVLGAPSSQSASLNINVNNLGFSTVGLDAPNQAQSEFFGTFSTLTPGLFTVTANYTLTQFLSSNDPMGFVFSDVAASLQLFGYDADGNPLEQAIASAQAGFLNSVNGIGTFQLPTLSGVGTLSLSFDLVPGTYDFASDATATASTVPEPGTFLLFGIGLLVIGASKLKNKITQL